MGQLRPSRRAEAQRRYPPELRERAVRLVFETAAEQGERHGAVGRVARQLGIGPESLRHWVRQAEIDVGQRAGLTSEERERMKQLERENRELRRANEIRNFAGWRLFRRLQGRPEVAVALAIFFGRMGLSQAMDALSTVVAEGREITRKMNALGEYYVQLHPEQRTAIQARGISWLAAYGQIMPLSRDEQMRASATSG